MIDLSGWRGVGPVPLGEEKLTATRPVSATLVPILVR